MICTVCKKSVPLTHVMFKPMGMIPNTTIKRRDAVCRDCIRSIDNTSRDPGSDDE